MREDIHASLLVHEGQTLTAKRLPGRVPPALGRCPGLGGASRPQFLTAKRPAELALALALALVAVVAVVEETIFRGYLILRLSAATRRPRAAASLSAVASSLGHGSESTIGGLTVAVMGLGRAVVYLWRRTLVAPASMRFLQDFVGIILLPLAGSG